MSKAKELTKMFEENKQVANKVDSLKKNYELFSMDVQDLVDILGGYSTVKVQKPKLAKFLLAMNNLQKDMAAILKSL